MNRQARALSLYSACLVVKQDAAISTGRPEASRGAGLARSPSRGAHRKASRDHLHEDSIGNLTRPGPREGKQPPRGFAGTSLARISCLYEKAKSKPHIESLFLSPCTPRVSSFYPTFCLRVKGEPSRIALESPY